MYPLVQWLVCWALGPEVGGSNPGRVKLSRSRKHCQNTSSKDEWNVFVIFYNLRIVAIKVNMPVVCQQSHCRNM